MFIVLRWARWTHEASRPGFQLGKGVDACPRAAHCGSNFGLQASSLRAVPCKAAIELAIRWPLTACHSLATGIPSGAPLSSIRRGTWLYMAPCPQRTGVPQSRRSTRWGPCHSPCHTCHTCKCIRPGRRRITVHDQACCVMQNRLQMPATSPVTAGSFGQPRACALRSCRQFRCCLACSLGRP